jgi:hypothetical protein
MYRKQSTTQFIDDLSIYTLTKRQYIFWGIWNEKRGELLPTLSGRPPSSVP